MKNLIFLLIIIFNTNCLFGKYSKDVYLYTQMDRGKSFTQKSLIDKVKVNETTFSEVLNFMDGSTQRRLTFDPLLPKYYDGKKYYIKYILSYYYNSMELRAEGHNTWETKEVIHVTIFFDKNEKVAFYYSIHHGGNEEYKRIPKGIPKIELTYTWPYANCDCKFYEEISDPVYVAAKSNKYGELEGCDWEKEYSSIVKKK